MFKRNEKGQLVLFDFMLGLVIFMVILAIFFNLWFGTLQRGLEARVIQIMKRSAFQTADLLVMSKGIPSNWYNKPIEDVNVIGLALEPKTRTLNKKSVQAFVGADYETLKLLLGIEGFDFYFTIQDPDGTIVESQGVNSDDVIYRLVTRRLVKYDNELRIMRFQVWLEDLDV